jgi:RNA polymerase sigma-70 factor (sigma-E family)
MFIRTRSCQTTDFLEPFDLFEALCINDESVGPMTSASGFEPNRVETISDDAADRHTRAATYSGAIARDYVGLARLAFLLCGNRADAEDLVAEAYARAWPGWSGGTVEDLGPYTRRILVNLNLDHRRRRFLELKRSTESTDAGVVSDPSHDVDRHIDLVRGLDALAPKQRTVIVLRYYADMSEEEVAKVLGIAVGTVKSRTSRALKTLGRFVEGGGSSRA